MQNYLPFHENLLFILWLIDNTQFLKSPYPTPDITRPRSGDFWGVALPLYGPDPMKNLICIYHHVCEIEFQINATHKQSVNNHNRDWYPIPPLKWWAPALALFSIYFTVPPVFPVTQACGNSRAPLPLDLTHAWYPQDACEFAKWMKSTTFIFLSPMCSPFFLELVPSHPGPHPFTQAPCRVWAPLCPAPHQHIARPWAWPS